LKKIKSLNNEETLKNILTKLDKSENKSEAKDYNLSQHFESISKRYDEALKEDATQNS
jgi:hypothetical protein